MYLFISENKFNIGNEMIIPKLLNIELVRGDLILCSGGNFGLNKIYRELNYKSIKINLHEII